jgi:hypothetical protein
VLAVIVNEVIQQEYSSILKYSYPYISLNIELNNIDVPLINSKVLSIKINIISGCLRENFVKIIQITSKLNEILNDAIAKLIESKV